MVHIATFLTTEVFRDSSGLVPGQIPALGDLYQYSPAPNMSVVVTYDKAATSGQRWVLTSVDETLNDCGDVIDELSALWCGQSDGWASALFDPLNRSVLATSINAAFDQNYGQQVALTISEFAFIYGAMLREYSYDVVPQGDSSPYVIADTVYTRQAQLSVNSARFGAAASGSVVGRYMPVGGGVVDTYCKNFYSVSGGKFGGGDVIQLAVKQDGVTIGTFSYTSPWWYWKLGWVEFFSSFYSGNGPEVVVSVQVQDKGGEGSNTITQRFLLDQSRANKITVEGYGVTYAITNTGIRRLTLPGTPGNPSIWGMLWTTSDEVGTRMSTFVDQSVRNPTIGYTGFTSTGATMQCLKKVKHTALFGISVNRSGIDKVTGAGELVVDYSTVYGNIYMDAKVQAVGDPTVTYRTETVPINYNALISAWDQPTFDYTYTGKESLINDITSKYILDPDEYSGIWMDFLADAVLEKVIDEMCILVESEHASLTNWKTIADLDQTEVAQLAYKGMTFGQLLAGELTEEQEKEYIRFLQDVRYYSGRRVLLRSLMAATKEGEDAYAGAITALDQAKTAIEGSISFVRDILDPRTRRALVYTSAEIATMHEDLSDVVSVAQARGVSLDAYVQRVDRMAANEVSNNYGLLIEADHERETFRQAVMTACGYNMPTNAMAEVFKDSSVNQIGTWIHDTIAPLVGQGSMDPEFIDSGTGLPGLSMPLYTQASRFPAELQDSFGASGLIKGRSLIVNLRKSYIAVSDGGSGIAMVSWHPKFHGGNDFDALVAIDDSMEEFLALGKACLEAALGEDVSVTDASISDDWLNAQKAKIDTDGAVSWVASSGLMGGAVGLLAGPIGGLVGMGAGLTAGTISMMATDNGDENRNIAIELYNSVNGPVGLTVVIGENTYVDDDAYAMMLTAIGWYLQSGAINPIDSREGVNFKIGILFPSYAPFRYLITPINTSIAKSVISVVTLFTIAASIRYLKLPKMRAGNFIPGLLAGAASAPLAWISNKVLEERVSNMSSSISSYPSLVGVMDEEGDDDVGAVREDVGSIKNLFESMSQDIKKAGSPEWAKKPYYTR